MQKVQIATTKEELPISWLVDKISSKFQLLPIYFQGMQTHRTYHHTFNTTKHDSFDGITHVLACRLNIVEIPTLLQTWMTRGD